MESPAAIGTVFGLMIPIVAIVGALAIVAIAIVSKSRLRELEIRERIAMIERGLVPPPEVDPHGFDRAMHRMDSFIERSHRGGPDRHRRVGVILMGVGFGMMVLIGFADRGHAINEAIGVGGFLVILGLAFLISSMFGQTSYQPPASSPPAATPPTPPRQS